MIALAGAIRTARSQAIGDALAAGGSLILYSGARPASGAAVTNQVALVALALPAPAATSEDGVLTFEPIAEAMAGQSGTAAWARVEDDAGAYVMDMGVSAAGAGGDVELSSVDIIQGGLVRITAGTIAEP